MKTFLMIILAATASLAACAKPTAITPVGSRGEVLREQQTQAEYIKSQQKVKLEELGDLSAQAVMPRVQAIAGRLIPASEHLCADMGISPASQCAYEISITEGTKNEKTGMVEPDTSLNAYADGDSVHISPAMVRFADDENDLAFILAHEFAHNIMRHVQSKMRNAMLGTLLGVAADMAANSQGYNTEGKLTQLGGGLGANAYSPSFEAEADYVGLYMLARAGYEYHSAPNFWRRMSVENPQAIYTGQTHPSNAERFVNMNKAIAEIDYKKANGLPLVPEFQKGN
jgi:predicted Zn-dependent protease